MAKGRHLKNAPITEALFDFRVQLPPGFVPEKFSALEKTLSGRYPKKKPIQLTKFMFGMEEGKPWNKPPEDEGVQGYLYTSADEKNIAQFRIDGFTHNRLKPYTTWDEVLDEAKRLWNLYRDAASPERVIRIAVRYINHLTIPSAVIDLSEYITNPPSIPGSIPQTVTRFLTRIAVQDPVREVEANITQALEKGIEPNCATIILDIDVYKKVNLSADDDGIWAMFAKMRELKNLIFFESITEKTAEMYQ